MERSLSKIRDVDLKILSELDDRDLLNFCKTGKYGNELCNNENFWRVRVQTKFPAASKIKLPSRSWKNFYLKIVYYIDKYRNADDFMFEAVRRNEQDMIDFSILRGASDWINGMKFAAKTGNVELVKFIIEKAELKGAGWYEYDWNMGLFWSAQGGHIYLMKFFIKNGANEVNRAMYAAAVGGHKNAIDYLISQGANMWYEGLHGAKRAKNEELIAFFGNKLI